MLDNLPATKDTPQAPALPPGALDAFPEAMQPMLMNGGPFLQMLALLINECGGMDYLEAYAETHQEQIMDLFFTCLKGPDVVAGVMMHPALADNGLGGVVSEQ